MRLQNARICNRAPFQELAIDFENHNITVLSGVNGTGKTTLISHIVDSFYELAKKAFFYEFEGRENKYYRFSSGIFSLDKSKPSIVYLRYLNDDGTFADYVDIVGKCTEGDYSSKISFIEKIPFENIKNNLESNESVKYWSLSDQEQITNIFNSSLMTYFPAYRFEKPFYLNDPYKTILEFKSTMKFRGNLENPLEVTSDMPQIANWIMDIVLDGEIYKKEALVIRENINLLLTKILFQKVHSRVRLGIGTRNAGASRIAIMDEASQTQIYPSIFNMSSGELALVCLFTELIKQSDVINKELSEISGIVLIDEVEKHLHIKLQKETLPELFKMFPNVQFIVSSHSPFFVLGLDESEVNNKILDFENEGLECSSQNNALFCEVYNMMIHQNQQFATQYYGLLEQVESNGKPLVITEGKTDWKHLKAAKKALKIEGIDVEFYENTESFGDTNLLQFLKSYARLPQQRKIIGVFDRDNFSSLSCKDLKDQKYVNFGNSVFALAIPAVDENNYGSEVSIEHYYKEKDLTKIDQNGRRLFLGSEFYKNGNSKNGMYQCAMKNRQGKVSSNGIIDEKVYKFDDLEHQNSLALSKNNFADYLENETGFAEDFDFSSFFKIFEILGLICSD